MILYFARFAKTPNMHNMAILYKATKWTNPRGACVQVYFFHACFFLELGFLSIGFSLSIQILITSMLYKSDKLRNLNVLRYYNIVSQKGIKVDPDKVKAIQEIPAPRTEKQVTGFLGL